MPIITFLGFDVPVFIIVKGFSKLGKSLKKRVKIESANLPDHSTSLNNVVHDLENAIISFERSHNDALLVQSTATLDIIFHLHRLANERALHLMAAVRVDNLNALIGYALCKKLPEGIVTESLLRPRMLHMCVNHQNALAGPQWASPSTGASFEMLNEKFIQEVIIAFSTMPHLPHLPTELIRACISYASTPADIIKAAQTQRALKETLDVKIVGYVLDYTWGISEALASIRLISTDTWDWLFLYTVRVDHISQEVSLQAERASDIVLTHKLRSSYSWNYTFFGRTNHVYFWNNSMRPLVASSTPPELHDLKSMLQKSHPFMLPLHECLPAVYNKPNHRLRWHQDNEGRAYHQMAEALAFIFTGAPRRLNFKPVFSMYPRLELIYSLKCTNNIIVTVTPLANEIFLHSKARSTCAKPSITLAWRRGIPFAEAMHLYPHLSKFKRLGK